MKTISLLITVLFLSACAQNDNKPAPPVRAENLTAEISDQMHDFNFRVMEFRNMVSGAMSADNSIGNYAPKDIQDNCVQETTRATTTAAGISWAKTIRIGGANCPIEVEATEINPNYREDATESWTNNYVIKSEALQKKYGFVRAQETAKFEFFVYSISADGTRLTHTSKSNYETHFSLLGGVTAKTWGNNVRLGATEGSSQKFQENLELNGNTIRREYSLDKGQYANKYFFNDKEISEEEFKKAVGPWMFFSFSIY